MPGIYVDTNALNNAVSSFEMSYKELEELIYRVNILGNEMLDDTELALLPGSERVNELCSSLSYELAQLNTLYSGIVDLFNRVPAMYSEIEQKTVEKISELAMMSDKVNMNVATALFGSDAEADDDGEISQDVSTEQDVKKARDSLDLADAAVLSNGTDEKETADTSSDNIEADVKYAREQTTVNDYE